MTMKRTLIAFQASIDFAPFRIFRIDSDSTLTSELLPSFIQNSTVKGTASQAKTLNHYLAGFDS